VFVQDRSPVSNEDELIRQAVGGDAEAFGELYAFYLHRIYRYIFYKVGNAMEAEDLTEQVFLRAWEVMERYRHQGYPFSSWLYRIAHNLVVDYYRTRKSVDSIDSVSFYLASEDLSPEESLIKKAEVTRLREAIARLPEEQQQLLLLRFIEGLRHAEVAQILDKSEGAVRVMQYRALSSLSDILGESWADD